MWLYRYIQAIQPLPSHSRKVCEFTYVSSVNNPSRAALSHSKHSLSAVKHPPSMSSVKHPPSQASVKHPHLSAVKHPPSQYSVKHPLCPQ